MSSNNLTDNHSNTNGSKDGTCGIASTAGPKCMCEALAQLSREELEFKAIQLRKLLALGIDCELSEIFNMEDRDDDPSDEEIMDYLMYQDALAAMHDSDRNLELYEIILPEIEAAHATLGDGGCFELEDRPGEFAEAHDLYHVVFLKDSAAKCEAAVNLREKLIEKYGLNVPELTD